MRADQRRWKHPSITLTLSDDYVKVESILSADVKTFFTDADANGDGETELQFGCTLSISYRDDRPCRVDKGSNGNREWTGTLC